MPRCAAVLIALLVVVSAFLMALRPVRSPDVWHHLKSGWFVVQNRGPASVDVFSCTAQGKPWIQYEWLAQATLYAVYRAGGETGLVLFQAAGAAAVALLLIAAIRAQPRAGLPAEAPALRSSAALAGEEELAKAGWTAAGLATALALCATSPRFFSRPEMFTWILFGGWLVAIEKVRAGRAGWFLLPAILMIPWVNLHGAWPAGLAWLGLICIGETILLRFRPATALPHRTLLRLWAALGLAAVATLVNPYGIRIWEVPFKLMGAPEVSAVIAEWKRPDLAHWLDGRHIGAWVFLLALLAAPHRLALSDALVALAFGILALTARRHLALAMIAVAPIAAGQMSMLWTGMARVCREKMWRILGSPRLAVGAVAFACAALVLTALGGFDFRLAGIGLDRRTIPEGAARFLSEQGLDGNLFNSYSYGNYLLFARYPRNHVFIDGRVDVYGPETLRLYAAVRNAEPGWQKVLDERSIEICVLTTEKSSETQLLDALHRSPDWALVYWDDLSAVYVRRAPNRREFFSRAYAYSVRPDDFDQAVFQSPERAARAERDYREKLREDTTCALAAYGLAECLIARGRRAEAIGVLEKAVALNSENGTLHYTLGAALLDMGKMEAAEKSLQKALARHRHEPEAHLALSVLYWKKGLLDKALRHCRKAFDLAPGNWKVSWNLSTLYEQKGDIEQALAMAREVVRFRPDMAPAAERVARLERKMAGGEGKK